LRIDLNKLKNLKILIPPSPEQEKIAEILSTIDERIQLLKEKKQKTERIKISLMNELLTGKKRVKL
jgi:type I restriction enzyme S subunit